MIEIGSLKVENFVLDELVVSWQVEIDPEENILDYEMFVLRSESPEGDFETVSPGLFDTYVFVDSEISTQAKWKQFYYKILAVDINGNQFFSEAKASSIATDLNLVGLEIARRNNILLKEYTGVKCHLLIMRKWGQYCTECWDSLKKQVRKSNCKTCYGVGRTGGYFKPIYPFYVQINSYGKSIDHANIGDQEPVQTNAWASNFPILSPGDIIVAPGNIRWRISGINDTTQLGTTVRQLMQLYYIDRSNIEYEAKL